MCVGGFAFFSCISMIRKNELFGKIFNISTIYHIEVRAEKKYYEFYFLYLYLEEINVKWENYLSKGREVVGNEKETERDRIVAYEERIIHCRNKNSSIRSI